MVHHEVLETPTQPAGTGVWTFYASCRINAPAHLAWSALIDFQSYPKWNHYSPTIKTPSGTNEIKPDDMITLSYRPEPTGKLLDVPCRILEVNHDEMRLCWRGCLMGIPTWILLPEKVQRITRVGEEECLYEIYETQGGPMAWVVKWMLGEKLSKYSRGTAAVLKGYVEGLFAESRSKR